MCSEKSISLACFGVKFKKSLNTASYFNFVRHILKINLYKISYFKIDVSITIYKEIFSFIFTF